MDVGSDRGDFAIALERFSKSVYAVENKKGPYKALVLNLERHASKVRPLLQDGLLTVPKDVDVVSILGMGGRTMLDILMRGEGYLSQLEFLLLSPQSEFELPIRFLNERGYRNSAGFYIHETRHYPVLLFENGEEELNEDELLFGPVPWRKRDVVLKELLEEELARLLSLPEKAKQMRKTEIEACTRRLLRWNYVV